MQCTRIFIASFLFLSLSFSPALFSQGTPAPDSKPGSEPGMESTPELEKKNIGTNLEKKYYFQISHTFKDKNLQSIRTLNVISNNFGDQVDGAKPALEKIKKDYQIALRYLYRRAYVLSGKAMLDIDRDINELFKKYSAFYENKTDELLTQSADAIITTEQNENMEPGFERNSRYREIQDNQYRLKIAYYNMGKADEMNREARFSDAIVHYRLAKEYGIKILSSLQVKAEDKKQVTDKFARDLSDNRGMTLRDGKEKEAN